MTRTDFIEYLVSNGCEIVREAKQGYSVIRNTASGKMSGVPKTDPPFPVTVCRICKTLEIDPPEVAKVAQKIIDHMQDQFESGFDQED